MNNFLDIMKILFLTLYPPTIASSRYRVYQYIDYLRGEGIKCTVCPAIRDKYFKKYFGSKTIRGKILFQMIELITRIKDILRSMEYDAVLVQKGLTSANWRWLKKLLWLCNKKIVYDFDDATYIHPPTEFPSRFRKMQDYGQIDKILKLSKQVIAGNEYLKNYAQQYNKNVSIIPTPINTERFQAKSQNAGNKIVIGWIGSSSTISYLLCLKEVFKKLSEKYPILVRTIGVPNFNINGLEIDSRPWSLETEVADLQSFDIGVMPMPENAWTKGKCGLKALQYMAVGIPVVCSPVGVNKGIIQDGVNGFLADSEEEWIAKLSLLIEQKDLRFRLGMTGRRTVEEKYSLKVNAPKLKDLLGRQSRGDKPSLVT